MEAVICLGLVMSGVVHSNNLHPAAFQQTREESDKADVTVLSADGSNGLKDGLSGVVEDRAVDRVWLGLGPADVTVCWSGVVVAGAAGVTVAVTRGQRPQSVTVTVPSARYSYRFTALPARQALAATVTPIGSHPQTQPITVNFDTPSLVPDEDAQRYMSMRERERGACPSGANISEVSVRVKMAWRGVGGGHGYVLQVTPTHNDKELQLQYVDLPPPNSSDAVSTVYLSGLQPGLFLNLTLTKIQSSDPLVFQDVLSRTVYTGGCLTPSPELSVSYLTRTLDLFFPSIGLSNRKYVRCYADDEVFSGFPCRQSDICVPLNWMCDKEEDCPDGDDEDDCDLGYHSNSYCSKNEFRCLKHGQHVCLPISWLCDGRHHCTDGWDEEPSHCRRYFSRPGSLQYRYQYQSTACRPSYFLCRNHHGCVSPSFVCDGEHDCADGSDEWNCSYDYECDSYDEFQCFQSKGRERCIPQSWMCDDQEDCREGEDEDFDVCRRVL